MIALLAAASVALAPAQRALDVSASLAVNIHIEYTDGGYRDLAQVLACLNYLRIGTVRDAAPNPRNQGQAGYAALAQAGVKFDLFVNGEELIGAIGRIQDLERSIPGAVISIEGPNEVNNQPGFNFNNEPDLHSAGAAYQSALYRLVKSTPGLSHIPVVAFTDYPYRAGLSDLGNEHPYPSGDSSVNAELTKVISQETARFPGQPLVFTELGYPTSKGKPGISELAQARLLLASLLGNSLAGIRKTYIYELLDAYLDPTGTDQEKHFGLFDLKYLPKLSGQMLRQVSAIFNDPGLNARDFPLRKLAVSWPAGGADAHKLIVQKSDGEVIVAIWRDKPVYDFVSRADVTYPPETINLAVGFPHGRIIVNDVIASSRGEVHAAAGLIRLSLGPDPLIIQITPSDGALNRSPQSGEHR